MSATHVCSTKKLASEKKRYEFYSLIMQLCFLKKQYSIGTKQNSKNPEERSVFSRQRSIREIFESGLSNFYGLTKFKGKRANINDFTYVAYLENDEQKNWHYEHVVPINLFLDYFDENCGNLSFEEFNKIIENNAEVCGVTESVNDKLNELYSNKMPDGRDFKDNNFFVLARYKKISEEFEKDGKRLILEKKKNEDDFEEISFDKLKKSVRN